MSTQRNGSVYRENAKQPLVKGPSPWAWLLLWCCKHFQWARRRMGGHWERHWISGASHANRQQDYVGRWGPWDQTPKCTEKYPGDFTPDTAGCPRYDECEDYGPVS